MRHFFSFFFISFSLILLGQAAVSVDILKETCKKVVKGNQELSYDFCLGSLGEEPKSHKADLPGLVVISANLTRGKAFDHHNAILNILAYQPPTNPDVKSSLDDCLKLYSSSYHSADSVIAALLAKDYKAANARIGEARDSVVACEDGFKKKGVESPVTDLNKDYFQLTEVSLGIAKLLH